MVKGDLKLNSRACPPSNCKTVSGTVSNFREAVMIEMSHLEEFYFPALRLLKPHF
jgi:hypothetical protein